MGAPAGRRRAAWSAALGAVCRLVALCLCLLALPAGAVIKRLYPLGDIIRDADMILVARVRANRGGLASVTQVAALKGRPRWSSARFRLTGSDDRTQQPILAARLRQGRRMVLFGKNGRFMLGYVEGTWFRLAEPPAGTRKPWQFVHLEVYLRRTFRGTTAELQRTVSEVLAGRAPAPPPDPNVEPGYGGA